MNPRTNIEKEKEVTYPLSKNRSCNAFFGEYWLTGILTTKFISSTNFLYLFPRAIVTWPLILVVDFDLQVINQSERDIGSCYINDTSQIRQRFLPF